MVWIEVALLIVGAGALAASFLVKENSEDEEIEQQVDAELIRSLIEKEMGDAKERVEEVVDETLEYAVEKTERASERISNEKIMAINEYADTVLADINKSHQEVMFLYDMLNDKHNNIKETVKNVDKTAREAEEAANAAAIALAAKAREEAEIKAREKVEAEAAKKEEQERSAALERASQDKEAREKEYARRQMARLILPMQQEMPIHSLNNKNTVEKGVNAANSNVNTDTAEINNKINESQPELRPLVVKSVEVITPETKPVEVYSFADQAPRVERPVKKEAQAAAFESTVNMMKTKDIHPVMPKPVEEIRENNNDKILRMHKDGLSNVDIAKELGLGVGEVKLVINLFKGAV